MIIQAIQSLRPNSQWVLINNSYDGLEWLDEFQTKPTKKEIDDEIVRLVAQQQLQQQIAEADRYLRKTDHKFYNGYKPKEGEDLVEIERLRDEAREFIRANEGDE